MNVEYLRVSMKISKMPMNVYEGLGIPRNIYQYLLIPTKTYEYIRMYIRIYINIFEYLRVFSLRKGGEVKVVAQFGTSPPRRAVG